MKHCSLSRSFVLCWLIQQIDTLEDKMKDALINNRVEFVDLLLEIGVSIRKFLTTDRLNNLFEEVTVSTTHDDVRPT